MSRLSYVAVAVMLVGLTTCGCATAHDGKAVPAGSASVPVTPSTAIDGASDFGDIKACDLLGKVLEGKGFDPPEASTDGGPNGCFSQKSLYATVGINLQVGSPYDQLDFDKDKQFPGDINGRRAIQIRKGIGVDGSCSIMMEQGPKSRVFVNTATTGMSDDQACDFVGSIAKAVEPMLPKVR